MKYIVIDKNINIESFKDAVSYKKRHLTIEIKLCVFFLETPLYFYKIRCIILNEINAGELVIAG